MNAINVIVEMNARFTSSNEIPVERATIKRAEWDVLLAEFERLIHANERAIMNGGVCPTHGPCGLCRAEKWLGDPRKSVEI
jgi:hypothetical protein